MFSRKNYRGLSIYSKAALITKSSCKLAVFVGTEQTGALYEVDDQLGPHLSYIEQPELIQNGDLVISSGQGAIFPYGFAIGTVVKNKQGSSYSLKLFTDLKNLRYCAILSRK
ncbi:rod shape-determining protein MreC [bacterium]|nr:MAG: rod shape-determining protein MreC [bacterium]